ncbi:MAG: TOBE domain-containing protein, partial [Naasia sp.]
MNKGRIEQLGAPEELYELPRTAFVATLLGQSNLFAGDVVESGDALGIDVAGRRIVIPAERARRHSGRIVVGVRPEKLLLHTSEPVSDAATNAIGPGRVLDVSFSGVSTSYLVAVPGLGTVTVFAQNMVFGPVVSVGAEVWLSWRVEHGFGLEDAPEDVPSLAAVPSGGDLDALRHSAVLTGTDAEH